MTDAEMNDYNDILASFIFGRCLECKRKFPKRWSATLLTKFPIEHDLTNEQRDLITSTTHEYINDIWTMCSSHRKGTTFSAYRLGGEQRINPTDHPSILNARFSRCWSAHVTSAPVDRSGQTFTVEIDLRRGSSGGVAHS